MAASSAVRNIVRAMVVALALCGSAGIARAACTTGVCLQTCGRSAVLTSPNVVLIYWGQWSVDPQENEVELDTFLPIAGGTRYWDVLTEYYSVDSACLNAVRITNTFSFSTVFWPPPPPSAPSLADELAVVDAVVAQEQNPPSTLYLVALPSNVTAPPLTGGNCAAHNVDPNTNVPFAELPYQQNAGCSYGSVASAVTSNAFHELAETITDPFINGWNGPVGEIADPCTPMGTTMGLLPTTGLNEGIFVGQKLWSNFVGGCATSASSGFVTGSVDMSGSAWGSLGVASANLDPNPTLQAMDGQPGTPLMSNASAVAFPSQGHAYSAGSPSLLARDSVNHVQQVSQLFRGSTCLGGSAARAGDA
jgi:hypothetical protein